MTLFHLIARAMPVLALLAVSACATVPATPQEPKALPGYEAVQDGDILVPLVPDHLLIANDPRGQVAYAGPERPGTIVVDPYARKLYLVEDGGTAMRYSIAVGRTGLGFKGSAVVGRKERWPSWTPTANMVRTYPEMYAEYAGGLPGGLINPLGARALYLYRNGRDSYFRIHGTADVTSIGRATSAGCIRLFNQDIMDLYERVPNGTPVRVRTAAESLALEGPIVEDIMGHAVPGTPENIAIIEKSRAAKARRDAAAAAAAGQTDAATAEASQPLGAAAPINTVN